MLRGGIECISNLYGGIEEHTEIHLDTNMPKLANLAAAIDSRTHSIAIMVGDKNNLELLHADQYLHSGNRLLSCFGICSQWFRSRRVCRR